MNVCVILMECLWLYGYTARTVYTIWHGMVWCMVWFLWIYIVFNLNWHSTHRSRTSIQSMVWYDVTCTHTLYVHMRIHHTRHHPHTYQSPYIIPQTPSPPSPYTIPIDLLIHHPPYTFLPYPYTIPIHHAHTPASKRSMAAFSSPLHSVRALRASSSAKPMSKSLCGVWCKWYSI